MPEKFVVTFKPGKEMEEKVRLLEMEAAAKAARQQAEASTQNNGVADHTSVNPDTHAS